MGEDIERLKEIEKLSRQMLKKIPEWMIFPNWDTKRCIVCKGWKKDPAGRPYTHGHTEKCARVQLEKLLNDDTE